MNARVITIFFLLLFIFNGVTYGQERIGLLAPDQGNQDSIIMALIANERRIVDSLTHMSVLNQKRISDSADRAQAMHWIHDTLYTWTKEAQVKKLRESKILLTKSRSKRKGLSLYDACLNSKDLKSDSMAELLRDSLFKKKRFAWMDGWPTIMGWHNEKYGRHLLQIVLNENSIIGYFHITRGRGKTPRHRITFYNLKGEILTDEEAIRNKNRIAAVFHSNRRGIRKIFFERWDFGNTYSRRSVLLRNGRYVKFKNSFSEYVIVNEHMITNWSYGTESIRNKMKSEIQFLSALLSHLKEQGEGLAQAETSADYVRLRNQFYSRICFRNSYYKLEPSKINGIKRELEKALAEQAGEFSK